jgi:hypothetical protein
MFKRIANNRDERSLAVQFRRKRFALFQSLLSRLDGPIHVLDVGGTEHYWKTMGIKAGDRIQITILNVNEDPVSLPYMTSILGDARSIQAEDGAYDIVFSNSVIEHVGTHEDQLQMAKEVRRVGKRYFIQTPNKYFPLEQHFLFPFFQFFPISLRTLLVQNFDISWYPKTPDAAQARHLVESFRLLSKKEFSRLFPDAEIYEEKILGMTKSFVAYGGWDR